MRPLPLALLALVLLAAGGAIYALLLDGDEGDQGTALDTPEDALHDVETPLPADEPPLRSLPAGIPDEAPATPVSVPASEVPADPVDAAVAEVLDEEARAALRVEALALSKSRNGAPAAALRWKRLVEAATTTEEQAEALAHLARAQARSGEHVLAIASYHELLRLPAEKPFVHHEHRLQLAVAYYNAKDPRAALDELQRLEAEADVAILTQASAAWMRVQSLDALGDDRGAREAAQALVTRFADDASARRSVAKARERLARED